MRAVLQRVSRAKVTVKGRVIGEVGAGLMILLGVGREDTSAVAASMAEKCANLRIFEDDQGKMNRSLLDVKGSALSSRSSRFTATRAGSGGQASSPLRRRNKPKLSTKNSAKRFASWVSTSPREFFRR